MVFFVRSSHIVSHLTRWLQAVDEQAAAIAAGLEECFEAETRRRLRVVQR